MTITYLEKDTTFDSWRGVTNNNSYDIGDVSQKKTNASRDATQNDLEFLAADHVTVTHTDAAYASGTATITVPNTNANRYKLRPGMNVVAIIGSTVVSTKSCVVNSITYSSTNVVLTLSETLAFSPTPANVVFTFTPSITSHLNDLEYLKVDRHGDTIRGDLIIDGNAAASTTGLLGTNETTFNLLNTNATTVNAFGASTDINVGAATGDFNVKNATTTLDGDLAVNGGDLSSTQASFNALSSNATQTTINVGNALTNAGVKTINVGTSATGGAVTVNVAGTQTLTGATTTFNHSGNAFTLVGNASATTANVFNTISTTVNAFGAGTSVTIGAATGTTTIANTNTVVAGDLAVNGGDITTTQGAGTLFNSGATTQVAIGALATTVSIGAATGTTTIAHDLSVNGGDILTNQTTFNIINTIATTVNAFGAATTANLATGGTTITIGAVTGTTTVRNALAVTGSITTNTLDMGTTGTITRAAANVASTSPTLIATLDKTIYRCAEVLIQAKQGTSYSITKLLMTHDGNTTSYESEFGSLGTQVGLYESSISGNNWNINVTQGAATSTDYKIIVTAIKV